MPCYSPLWAWLSKDINPTGKRSLVFSQKNAFASIKVQVPCGQCVGCRLERSRVWAIRCVHEASLYDKNCFITLTFRDDEVPINGSLVKADFQKFMKRLRKCCKGDSPVWNVKKNKNEYPIRYFHCGEYGTKLERPHHHACLFNFDFPDKIIYTIKNGFRLYSSALLDEIWGKGFALIGDVTFESAAYCARYLLKKFSKNKVYPELKDAYYKGRLPEYTTMSRKPGIGKLWFEKFHDDVFPDGFVTVRGGMKCRVPKYYEEIFDLTNSEDLAKIKSMRVYAAFNDDNNKPKRLRVRCHIQKARLALLKRGLENAV